jgi:hypothetical protein
MNRALHIPSIAPLQCAAEAAVTRSPQAPRRVVARPQSVAVDRAAFRGDLDADTTQRAHRVNSCGVVVRSCC